MRSVTAAGYSGGASVESYAQAAAGTVVEATKTDRTRVRISGTDRLGVDRLTDLDLDRDGFRFAARTRAEIADRHQEQRHQRRRHEAAQDDDGHGPDDFEALEVAEDDEGHHGQGSHRRGH